jgi:hypothetical protein
MTPTGTSTPGGRQSDRSTRSHASDRSWFADARDAGAGRAASDLRSVRKAIPTEMASRLPRLARLQKERSRSSPKLARQKTAAGMSLTAG